MNEIYYEKILSIDTKKSETRMDACKLYNRYEPTPYLVLEKLLNSYDISESDHLVDFGSGKGRVAFFLNYFTGAGVTGVELVGEFYDKSVNNYRWRSEEHTSELQSRQYLVCRLLLEKKK